MILKSVSRHVLRDHSRRRHINELKCRCFLSRFFFFFFLNVSLSYFRFFFHLFFRGPIFFPLGTIVLRVSGITSHNFYQHYYYFPLCLIDFFFLCVPILVPCQRLQEQLYVGSHDASVRSPLTSTFCFFFFLNEHLIFLLFRNFLHDPQRYITDGSTAFLEKNLQSYVSRDFPPLSVSSPRTAAVRARRLHRWSFTAP